MPFPRIEIRSNKKATVFKNAKLRKSAFIGVTKARGLQKVWPVKSRQMSIKVAQKWFC